MHTTQRLLVYAPYYTLSSLMKNIENRNLNRKLKAFFSCLHITDNPKICKTGKIDTNRIIFRFKTFSTLRFIGHP